KIPLIKENGIIVVVDSFVLAKCFLLLKVFLRFLNPEISNLVLVSLHYLHTLNY
ncbi:hypothetical protein LCGC14_2712830, partial [marine sediment metagenome]